METSIAHRRYKTINDCLRAPSSVFEELIDSNGTTVVVARDASSVDDKLLASEHARRVGDKVLAPRGESRGTARPPRTIRIGCRRGAATSARLPASASAAADPATRAPQRSASAAAAPRDPTSAPS